MLDFTLSRVALCICGVLLLGAVAAPLTGIYAEKEDGAMAGETDSLAGLLDTFYYSEAETLTLRGWEILPGSDCSLYADGHFVILTSGKGEYRSITECECSDITIGYGDTVTLKRTADGLAAV
ncbi:MAG: hypothetical protein ACOX8L_04125 [Candidatus Methanomethylophilaceae archaeon]